MTVATKIIQCPACGANLSVEEGREKIFCTYCGSQVTVTNENEHIFRHIDEAKIKQAETDQVIRLKEMELEEKENRKKRKSRAIAYGIALGFVLIGALICIWAPLVGMWGVIIGGWIALYTAVSNDDSHKKRQKRYANPDEVCISELMTDYYEKNYNVVVQLFQAAGFSNVNAVPLNDLNSRTARKNGQVEDVSINGNEDFEEGDIFPKDSTVLITYHSK